MPHCQTCGERLRRIHRTFPEKFFYMGIFECPQCKERKKVERRYTYHLSERARCPLCGTYRLRVLAERDRIDKMHRNPLNVIQGMLGAKLYHCRYCRIQFYDRRRPADLEKASGTVAGPTAGAATG